MNQPTTLLPAEADSDKTEERESGKMSFLEHLDELRKRILRVILYIGIGFAASFYFAPRIYEFLAIPVKRSLPEGYELVFTKVTEPFALFVKVAILAGIFLTIPFTLHEVWKFISPGLYQKEKRYVIPFLLSSVLLFLGGGAFAYYIVLPRAYNFLLGIGEGFTPMITVREYMDLTNTIILGFGLVFEMPVIVAFLSLFGLVTGKFLLSKFKYAVLIIFILAAIISPTPDAITQTLYAGPMVLLYLVSVIVAYIFGWRRKRKGLD